MILPKIAAALILTTWTASMPISDGTLDQTESLDTSGTNETLLEYDFTMISYPVLNPNYYNTLKRYSEFAALAYCTRRNAGLRLGPLEEACSCKLCHGYDVYVETIFKSDADVSLYRDDARHEFIFAIKGTTKWREWITDANAAKRKYFRLDGSFASSFNDLNVHSGFYKTAKRVWNDFMKEEFLNFQKSYPNYSITLTGHSMGGALAVLLATELRQRRIDCRVVTFGSPKFAGSKMSKLLNHFWNVESTSRTLTGSGDGDIPINSYVRVVNLKDVIPFLPTVDLAKYHHSGSEVIFCSVQDPASFESAFVRGQFNLINSINEERQMAKLFSRRNEAKFLHNTYITPMNKCVEQTQEYFKFKNGVRAETLLGT